MNIPDEAVEDAARVMLDKLYSDKTLKVDDEDRDIMRAALEAAAPLIAAQAWDEGFITAEDEVHYHRKSGNPYREATR